MNPNYVETAPIVIKKNKSIDSIGSNAVEDDDGVVPSEAGSGSSSVFENLRNNFLMIRKTSARCS